MEEKKSQKLRRKRGERSDVLIYLETKTNIHEIAYIVAPAIKKVFVARALRHCT